MDYVNEKHVLHKEVGSLLCNLTLPEGCKLILDQACGKIDKDQQIPLFSSSDKSWAYELCKVDILILKQKQISVIIEIEESGINPTKICGKFLTSALATHYIHRTEPDCPILMADKVLFVQIVDLVSLPDKTKKREQLIKIEESIRKILPISGSHIKYYDLVCIESDTRTTEEAKMVSHILKHLG